MRISYYQQPQYHNTDDYNNTQWIYNNNDSTGNSLLVITITIRIISSPR